jgi:hypothetical protein
MKRFSLMLCCALLTLASGCKQGPTHESLTAHSVSNLRDAVMIMRGVTDEMAAIDARPKLQVIQKSMKLDKAALDKLGEPSPAEMEKLRAEYEPQFTSLESEFEREARRISRDPKLAKHMIGATSILP